MATPAPDPPAAVPPAVAPPLGGADLAGRLGVSPRTLRRDIDRLRDLGYPVEARRGVDGGYRLAAGAVLPPLLLDDEEAVAIGVGLQSAVQAGTVIGIEEASVRALGKVTQVMPSRLRRRIEALAAMTVPAPWAEAAARRRRRRAGVRWRRHAGTASGWPSPTPPAPASAPPRG